MKTKIIETKQGIVKEDLGYLLHVALRKICDTPETTLAWNLLGLNAMQPAWARYLEQVWDKLDQYTAKNVHALLETVADEIVSTAIATTGCPFKEQMILHCAFNLFSVYDWECFASTLAEEMNKHKAEPEPAGAAPQYAAIEWTDQPTARPS